MRCRDFARATGGAPEHPGMADEIKRVSANGTEFAYVEPGQRDPVVFVHGALQDYRMWPGIFLKWTLC
jgi:non-heme chloroperoxidase